MKKPILILLPSAFLLGACTVGPDFVPPAAHVPENYAAPGDSALPNDQKLTMGATPDLQLVATVPCSRA